MSSLSGKMRRSGLVFALEKPSTGLNRGSRSTEPESPAAHNSGLSTSLPQAPTSVLYRVKRSEEGERL